MKKVKNYKGNTLVEYTLTILVVGIAFGMFTIDPETFAGVLQNSFSNTTRSGNTLNIGAIDNAASSGINDNPIVDVASISPSTGTTLAAVVLASAEVAATPTNPPTIPVAPTIPTTPTETTTPTDPTTPTTPVKPLCSCAEAPICPFGLEHIGDTSVSGSDCNTNTCPIYKCKDTQGDYVCSSGAGAGYRPDSDPDHFVSDCAIQNIDKLSSRARVSRPQSWSRVLDGYVLAAMHYDPRLQFIEDRIIAASVDRFNALNASGIPTSDWNPDDWNAQRIAEANNMDFIEEYWSPQDFRDSKYPACMSVCYDPSISHDQIHEAMVDVVSMSDDLLCKLYWYGENEDKPLQPNTYPISDDEIQSLNAETARRCIADPYKVTINGEDYVFVIDRNNDGKLDSVKELLGYSETLDSRFSEMKTLDKNKDGYVSSDELKSSGVRLLKLDKGQLTTNEYSLDNIKGIDIASFTTQDQNMVENFESEFQVELVDNTTAKGRETFDPLSVLVSMFEFIKDFFFGVANNISSIFN